MSVVVKYVDLDDNLVELANSGELEGKVGERIEYSTKDLRENNNNLGLGEVPSKEGKQNRNTNNKP